MATVPMSQALPRRPLSLRSPRNPAFPNNTVAGSLSRDLMTAGRPQQVPHRSPFTWAVLRRSGMWLWYSTDVPLSPQGTWWTTYVTMMPSLLTMMSLCSQWRHHCSPEVLRLGSSFASMTRKTRYCLASSERICYSERRNLFSQLPKRDVTFKMFQDFSEFHSD